MSVRLQSRNVTPEPKRERGLTGRRPQISEAWLAEAKLAFLSSGSLQNFSRRNGQPSNVRVGSVQYGMALGPPGPRDFYACMIWDREIINGETVEMLINGKWVQQDTLETRGAALFRQNGDSTWEANLVDYVGSPFYNRNCT